MSKENNTKNQMGTVQVMQTNTWPNEKCQKNVQGSADRDEHAGRCERHKASCEGDLDFLKNRRHMMKVSLL